MSSRYELRQQLEPAHADDVKVVLAVSDDCIASGSRDGTVGIWKTEGGNGTADFKLKAILGGHGAYVNSLAHILGRDGDFIASGGNSSLILLHSLDSLSPESVHALLGHALNVCTLAYSSRRRRLISGSWDKTARVWIEKATESARSTLTPGSSGAATQDHVEDGHEGGWETELVLEGHDEAVWGVAVVDEGPKEGCYLTGSADRLINLWGENGDCLLRIKGSPEPIRSLSVFAGGTNFASACNDGLVRIWDLTGNILKVFKGHTDYVYDVLTRGSEIISCGEDHTVRVWQEDGSHETVSHPCQTVWSVDSLPNGDIVSGGSDGKIRLWSREGNRKAAQATKSAYETEVHAAIREAQIQGINATSSAPSPDPQGEQRPMTIDIDISDDAPPIPLEFTPGDDPAQVARRFGQEHSLSDNYVRQITEFIELHLGQITLEQKAPSTDDTTPFDKEA